MTIYKSEIGKTEINNYYDKLLESLEVDYEKLKVSTSFGNTFVIKSGVENGEKVVLLHGSGINSSMWVSDINELSKKYQAFAVDILGECGKSDETMLDYKNNDYSNWLNEVLENLGLEYVNIIGASLGGWISVKYAINNSKKVKKLVLLAPAGIGGQNPIFLPIALFYMALNKREKLFDKVNGTKMPKEIMDYQILINKYFITRKDVLPVFTEEELNKIEAKVNIYVGEKDIILNSKKTIERSKFIKNIKVESFKNLGHSLINMTDKIIKDLDN